MKQLPAPTGRLPEQWLDAWQAESPVPFIETWQDPDPLYEPIPRKVEISEKNVQMLERALHMIRSQQ